MTRATPHRHATQAADLMGLTLEQAMASPMDCAMLVMLLYAIGYTDTQVNKLLAEHAISRNRQHLEIGIHLYRFDTNRRQQYRLIIDQLNREDERNPRKESRAAAGAGQKAEEGERAGLGLAAGERAARGVRPPPKPTARKGTTPARTAAAHQQHSQW